MELFGYASLIGVGLLLGMMGGGGSILSVPILVYLFSLDVVVASSYSLFIVGSTSVGSALLSAAYADMVARRGAGRQIGRMEAMP